MEHHEQKQGSNYFRAGQMEMNNAHIYYIFSSFNKTKIEIKTRVSICLFVTEEIPITVSRQAPDKEAWPSS